MTVAALASRSVSAGRFHLCSRRQDGGVVADDAAHASLLGVGRENYGRDAGAVHAVISLRFARFKFRLDVVGRDRGRRRDVVVVAAVLVVGVDQQGAVPTRRPHDRFDDFVRPDLPVVHVLGILLRLGGRDVLKVGAEQSQGVLDEGRQRRDGGGNRGERADSRVHEADRRQTAGFAVVEEPAEQVVMIEMLDDDRWDHRRHRHVSEVVPPTDVQVRQAIEDRAVRGWGIEERLEAGDGPAVSGAGEQETAVRVGRSRDRAEPAIAKSERFGERVGERQHLGRVVPHRLLSTDRLDEPVHRAAVDLFVGSLPALRHILCLSGVRQRERRHLRRRARAAGVGVRCLAGAVEGQAVHVRARAGELSEQIVEGVVLHHDHDDVVERHVFVDRADRLAGERQAASFPCLGWGGHEARRALTTRANIAEVLIIPSNGRLVPTTMSTRRSGSSYSTAPSS